MLCWKLEDSMTQAFQSAVTPLLMKWFRTLCLLSFSPEIRIANKHKTVISTTITQSVQVYLPQVFQNSLAMTQ